MSGKQEGTRIFLLPEDDKVAQVLGFREYHADLVSARLTGALMAVQTGNMEVSKWQEFVEEYNLVLSKVLNYEREQKEQKRSFSTFVEFIAHTFHEFPESEVIEYTVREFAHKQFIEEVNSDCLFFYEKNDILLRISEVYAGNIPQEILKEIRIVPDDAYSISMSCIVSSIEEDDDDFGIEYVFEFTYSTDSVKNQELAIAYTCINKKEGYDVLLRMTNTEVPISKILHHNNTDVTEEDILFVLEDDDIRNKLHRVDIELYNLLDLFVDKAHQTDRHLMLSSLNKRLDRKNLLETYASEWSIGRLSYLLDNNIGKGFNLRVFDEYEPGPHKLVSMLQFPTYNRKCENFFKSITQIFGTGLENHRGRKDIRCEFWGTVKHKDSVKINMYVSAVKNKSYTYTATLSALQMLSLITLLVGEEVEYMNHAFDRVGEENRDDYDDDERDDSGYDDYEEA